MRRRTVADYVIFQRILWAEYGEKRLEQAKSRDIPRPNQLARLINRGENRLIHQGGKVRLD
jgi:hypothetical protein